MTARTIKFPCLLKHNIQILTPNHSYCLENWKSWKYIAKTERQIWYRTSTRLSQGSITLLFAFGLQETC